METLETISKEFFDLLFDIDHNKNEIVHFCDINVGSGLEFNLDELNENKIPGKNRQTLFENIQKLKKYIGKTDYEIIEKTYGNVFVVLINETL